MILMVYLPDTITDVGIKNRCDSLQHSISPYWLLHHSVPQNDTSDLAGSGCARE